MLDQLLLSVPELRAFANLKLEIPFNLDSSRVGPPEWIKLARLMHDNRDNYDAFLIVHGTDTMAYTAAALSCSPASRNPSSLQVSSWSIKQHSAMAGSPWQSGSRPWISCMHSHLQFSLMPSQEQWTH